MNQNDIMAAIEYLKEWNLNIEKDMNDPDNYYFESYEELKASLKFNKLAISALEKQISKPPEHKVHEDYKVLGKNYYCKCGVMFYNWENQPTNFCGNCGQKLKGS